MNGCARRRRRHLSQRALQVTLLYLAAPDFLHQWFSSTPCWSRLHPSETLITGSLFVAGVAVLDIFTVGLPEYIATHCPVPPCHPEPSPHNSPWTSYVTQSWAATRLRLSGARRIIQCNSAQTSDRRSRFGPYLSERRAVNATVVSPQMEAQGVGVRRLSLIWLGKCIGLLLRSSAREHWPLKLETQESGDP